MTFVGFDLHKRYITACALDSAGDLIAEVRQLPTAVEAIQEWLDALPGPDGLARSHAVLGMARRTTHGARAHGACRPRLPREAHLAGTGEDRPDRCAQAARAAACESLPGDLDAGSRHTPAAAVAAGARVSRARAHATQESDSRLSRLPESRRAGHGPVREGWAHLAGHGATVAGAPCTDGPVAQAPRRP